MLWTIYCLALFLILLDPGVCFKFTIVHNNDMHARYDPVKGSGQRCPVGDDEKGLCFGGLARVATALTQARAAGPTLYLNAGDTYKGSQWYGVYKGELAAELMNLLKPDAVALGNHELDDNVSGLLPFLDDIKSPIVCCNMNVSKEPSLENHKNLVKSTIITRLGRKIGIIGYITPMTKLYVPANRLEYNDEVESINREAEKLIAKGVNIIIALGHSGYEKDVWIAWLCPDVDIVVGGHSHSFLYTGTPPDDESPEGDYPTIITRSNGQQVLVLQAYAFTKYLGKIDVEFDNRGILTNFNGTPMLLDSTVPLQTDIKDLLDVKRLKIALMNKEYWEERYALLKTVKSAQVMDVEEMQLLRIGMKNMGNVVQTVDLIVLLSSIQIFVT